MRDYAKIDGYLSDLASDVYPQPVDKIHKNQTRAVFYTWIRQLAESGKVRSALDVGCGQGVAFKEFVDARIEVKGIALGIDVVEARINEYNINVSEMDMHFITLEDSSVDLVYARHVLEHSPMPLLALMELHKVSRKYGVFIMPHHENVVQGGINHYYMLNPVQWKVLFARSKWEVLKEDYSDPSELRFLVKKIV